MGFLPVTWQTRAMAILRIRKEANYTLVSRGISSINSVENAGAEVYRRRQITVSQAIQDLRRGSPRSWSIATRLFAIPAAAIRTGFRSNRVLRMTAPNYRR